MMALGAVIIGGAGAWAGVGWRVEVGRICQGQAGAGVAAGAWLVKGA